MSKTSPDPENEPDPYIDPDPEPDIERAWNARAAIFGVKGDRGQNGEETNGLDWNCIVPLGAPLGELRLEVVAVATLADNGSSSELRVVSF